MISKQYLDIAFPNKNEAGFTQLVKGMLENKDNKIVWEILSSKEPIELEIVKNERAKLQ